MSHSVVARAYDANRTTVIEGVIEAEPVAVYVRKLGNWVGTASDFLRGDDVSKKTAGRRAQTFPRVLGIEISFSREGDQEREPSG